MALLKLGLHPINTSDIPSTLTWLPKHYIWDEFISQQEKLQMKLTIAPENKPLPSQQAV